jgi:hypothetical protein
MFGASAGLGRLISVRRHRRGYAVASAVGAIAWLVVLPAQPAGGSAVHISPARPVAGDAALRPKPASSPEAAAIEASSAVRGEGFAARFDTEGAHLDGSNLSLNVGRASVGRGSGKTRLAGTIKHANAAWTFVDGLATESFESLQSGVEQSFSVPSPPHGSGNLLPVPLSQLDFLRSKGSPDCGVITVELLTDGLQRQTALVQVGSFRDLLPRERLVAASDASS